MTDQELDAAWASKFGGIGSWANDVNKLDLSKLTGEQQIQVGKVVAYYYPPTTEVFAFYMSVLTVPNRAIMESILIGEEHE